MWRALRLPAAEVPSAGGERCWPAAGRGETDRPRPAPYAGLFPVAAAPAVADATPAERERIEDGEVRGASGKFLCEAREPTGDGSFSSLGQPPPASAAFDDGPRVVWPVACSDDPLVCGGALEAGGREEVRGGKAEG